MENGTSAGNVTLVATTGANTKTTVNNEYTVKWTKGDAFYVFGKKKANNSYSSKGTFNWTSGTDTEGTFTGTVTGKMADLQYAVYPADKYTYSSGKMTVKFPETYTHPNSNAPMFGKVNPREGKVEFKKLLCGMMRVTVNKLPTGKSGSLKLEGTNVAGPATLTIDDEGNPSLAAISTDGKNAVTVSFTNSSDPLVLDIPLPEGEYTDGLIATLTITDTSDPAEAFNTGSFTVTAGKIKEMPEINIASITSSTISFEKEVESVTDAIQALAEGSKNVTINEVKTGDAIEIPESDSPITINIKTVGDNFAVKGAEGAATTPVVKINVPEGSTGTVNVENVERIEISGGWSEAVTGDASKVLEVKAGTNVKELAVEKIEHIEVSGTWEKVTASTGQSTFVVKADAVVKELTVEQGNIEIKEGGVVNKLTLNNDVTINNQLIIPAGESMEVILGTHELTLSSGYTLISAGSSLKLTGESSSNKGKVKDAGNGIDLYEDNANFTMENVAYEATNKNGYGVFTEAKVSSTTINIKNSTMKGKYYCVATNALEKVGTGNVITLEGSDFTADETALMVNTPATVTAKNCNFTGGWQGAFLRAGKSTFDACGFNLDVNSGYAENEVKAGATVWGTGNAAPSAAITAGNKTDGNAYKRKADFELKNGCTFSVKIDGNVDTEKTYPAIYIDAENEETQGVTFKYDNKAFESAGTGLDIRNKDKVTEVNNIPI